eukprot:12921121-Prorocentrum_lima.AAC.1
METGGTATGPMDPLARAKARAKAKAKTKAMAPMPTIMEVDVSDQSASAAAAPGDETMADPTPAERPMPKAVVPDPSLAGGTASGFGGE